MSQPLVISHGSCFDGFTAAWIADKRWRTGAHDARPEHFFATYGKPAPLVTQVRGRHVLMVDFSYPRPVIEVMAHEAETLIILDHHKTAEAELAGLDYALFDMKRSGAALAWDVLTGGEPRPPIVEYVQDRDLWTQALPKTHEVTAWMSSVKMEFSSWDLLAEEIACGIAAQKGAAVVAYIEQYGRKARAEVTFEEVGGYKVPCINLPYMNCSEHVGELLKEHPDAAFAAGYFRRGDGRWQFSLRSRPGYDVAEIAKWYGGGGHAQAAGFDVLVLPWEV